MAITTQRIKLAVRPLIDAAGDRCGWAFMVTRGEDVIGYGGGKGLTREKAMKEAERLATEFGRQELERMMKNKTPRR